MDAIRWHRGSNVTNQMSTWIENKVSRESLPAGPGASPATDECTHSARSRLKIGSKLGDTHLARLMYHSD